MVTGGDPAGCSPWLALKLLEKRRDDESFVMVGPAVLRNFLESERGRPLGPGVEWVEAGEPGSGVVASGDPDERTGEAAYQSLVAALERCDEDVDGLLTLPLSKAAVQAAGHPDFVGHTELLEDYFDTEGVMTFFGADLVVALLTRHCPLGEVPDRLDAELLARVVRTVARYYRNDRGVDPALGLLGLNPHAGEDGRIGRTEVEVLEPAVEELRDEDYDVRGPYPADSFLPVGRDEVDVVLACYHDQGLVPFKQKHFFDGVHATLGLPVRRVSPDHGVAADVAPSGNVDPTSALNCLRWLRGDPPRSA